MSLTMWSALSWWARMQPDTMMLSVAGEAVTFREFQQWAERIAADLIARGIRPGDRVAVSGANSLQQCALMFGTIRAGAITLPLSVRYTAHEVGEALEETTPRLLFADAARAEQLRGVPLGIEPLARLDALREGPAPVIDLDLDPDWPVVIISTSGSTARPKGVVWSHRSVCAQVSEYAFGEPVFRPGAKAFAFSPLSSAAGFVKLCVYALTGISFFLDANFDAERTLELIAREKIAIFFGVPVVFERIAALPQFASADVSSIKAAAAGGDRVGRELLEKWHAKGVILRQSYGQTETGGPCTLTPEHLALARPDSAGCGSVFTELRIADADGRPLGPGAVGEILIRSAGNMVGYWNNPEATAATLRDGWIHSGDLGTIDADGMLTFIDRSKEMIVSGGFNIAAAEVERAVGAYPGVVEVAVIAAPDPKFSETPLAVIHADRAIDVAELIRHCNARLADYKVPRYVVVSPEPLPRTITGKVAKPAIREQYLPLVPTLERVR